MEKKLHCITGLPRSGSSLLVSILKQNPKFHASVTDSLANVIRVAIENAISDPGMKSMVPDVVRRSIVKKLIEAYYDHIPQNVVFNTNRGWTYLTELMNEISPESKFIVCVRDIKWVLDSFELLHRTNPLNTSSITGTLSYSVYDRVEELMKADRAVGFAYVGIKQVMSSPNKHKLMFVEYDQLCKNPEGMMKAVYNFIGEEYYQHDFDNVEAGWDEFDRDLGMPYHKVHKKVQFKPREFILPPDILHRYSNMEVWKM